MNFVVPQVCCELLVQRAWRVVSDTHVSLCTLAIAQDLDTLPPPEEEDLPPDVGNDVVVTHRTRCLTSGKQEVATALFPVTRKVIKKLGIQPYNITELREFCQKYNVPGPLPHSFMEVFCPPRLCPVFQKLGLCADISVDLSTRWDLSRRPHVSMLKQLVDTLKPHAMLVSPPCLAFSQIQRTNRDRSDPDLIAAKLKEGCALLQVSMMLAKSQLVAGRVFVFEHPAYADSWKEEVVMSMARKKGVETVIFDQCCFGACTKITKTPVQKSTKFMTNSSKVADVFRGRRCLGDHEHQQLEGQEGGVSRTSYAAAYPQQLVETLVNAIIDGFDI